MSIAQFTIDLMKTSIFWVNEKGIIENINQSTCRALGYQRLELLGMSIVQIDPKLKKSIWKQYWRAIKESGTTDFETTYFAKTGQSIPVKIEAFFADLPDQQYVVLRAKDWTISSRYQQLFEVTERVAKIGAWDWNLETNEILNTREVYNIYDLDPDDLLNSNIGFQSFKGKDLEQLEQAIEATKVQKTPFDLLLNFTSTKGVQKIVHLSAVPKIFNNKVVKLQGILQDVTRERAAAQDDFLKDTTIATIGELIFWVDRKGRFSFVNNAVVQNLGYSKEEMLERYVWDIDKNFHPEEWEAAFQGLKEKKRARFQTIHFRKDGSFYPTEIEQTYIEFNGTECLCSVARNNEALYESEEQLRLIQFTIEQAEEMIFWLDEDGQYVFVNNKVCKEYGYTEEALLSMDVFVISKELTLGQWKEIWQKLKKEKRFIFESKHYKKTGDFIIVEVTANYINYIGKEIVCAFVRDITNKKELEQRIQLTTRSIEQARDIILWTDPKTGKLLYFNKAVEQQLGYTAQEFYEIKSKDLIADYDVKGQKKYRKTLANKQEFIGECSLIRKDGTKMIMELKSSLVQLEDTSVNCSIFRDISVRKAKEQELQQLLAENMKLKEGLEAENTYLNQELGLSHNFDDIISTSPKYAAILANVEEVADTGATVLITGETGTGKELLARAVHQLSDRSDRPLVKINCAALPENLIESELFGHEKGAFTGAITRKIGRFELANHATLFLDEIGEMPIELQPKLLRVLQEGEFSRLGSNKTLKTDVRIIAATNRDLPKMVAAGTFREDLYYRLNVYPIHNIPLRERKEDIPLLVRHFLKKFNDRIGRHVIKVSARSLTKLQSYDYPGNIRELENIIERAVITSKTETLDLRQWQPEKVKKSSKKQPFLTFEAMERKYIIDALQETKWRVSGENGAAKLLGLKGKTLDSKMRRLNIKRSDFMISK